MRRLFAALVMVALALALTACGGGEESGAPAAGDSDGTAPPPATPPAVEEIDLSGQPVETVWEQFPQVRGALPETVADLIEAGQPMLIFFYDSRQSDSDDQRAQIGRVTKKYSGLIDLVSFNVSTALDEDSVEDTSTAEFSNLAGVLGVENTPTIIMVNSDGYVTWRARGFVDSKLIEQGVLRTTQ